MPDLVHGTYKNPEKHDLVAIMKNKYQKSEYDSSVDLIKKQLKRPPLAVAQQTNSSLLRRRLNKERLMPTRPRSASVSNKSYHRDRS